MKRFWQLGCLSFALFSSAVAFGQSESANGVINQPNSKQTTNNKMALPLDFGFAVDDSLVAAGHGLGGVAGVGYINGAF